MGNYLNNNDIRPSIFDIALSYENGMKDTFNRKIM